VEIDGKLQPRPKSAVAKRSVTEETLWKTQIKGGALKLDTTIKLKLTNLRAMRDDQWLMLKDCDIIVTNKAAQSGTIVGDIQFIKQGAPVITFTKVNDPNRIAAMAIAAKEHVLALIKEGEEEIKAEEEAIARMKAQGINDITCSRCTKKNPLDSKFCSNCGSPL
jgi:hypothetical protein